VIPCSGVDAKVDRISELMMRRSSYLSETEAAVTERARQQIPDLSYYRSDTMIRIHRHVKVNANKSFRFHYISYISPSSSSNHASTTNLATFFPISALVSIVEINLSIPLVYQRPSLNRISSKESLGYS
jgi:hypothetical protein